jgi:hypothetical protein
MEMADYPFYPQSTKGYRLTILTQLRQVIEAMHHPEELFQWLASVIMQRFDVPIVQLWSYENGRPGQPSAQLLAMASQNPAQPLHVMNEKVATTVEHISSGQRITYPQPVEQVFPHYVALLLKRYGLSYCASCVFARNRCSAPVEFGLTSERASMGFTCIALLFIRYNVDQDLISTISVILEQAIAIAESRHLLLPVAPNTDRLAPLQDALPQEILPALPGLVPRRKQDGGLMLSSNPFAGSVPISDKQALRLYGAIDGRKTVAELCRIIGMNLKEAQSALQTLLRSQQIEMYTQDGLPVDSSLLFNNR